MWGDLVMDEFFRWQGSVLARELVNRLQQKNYSASYCDTKEEAKQKILDMLEENSTIGLGGSYTLNQLGIIDEIRSGPFKLLDRYDPRLTPQQVNEVLRQSLLCDYYLTSTNAITLDGQLINIDGRGNRVAAMIFGPKKLIIVAGVNKIVNTVEEGILRTRNLASPRNAKRLEKNTPCTITGKCEDCGSSDRICRHMVITHSQMIQGRATFIIVGESLGF